MSFKKSLDKRGEKEYEGRSFAGELPGMLGLSDEIVLNVPRFIISGKSGLLIENYKGIVEFETGKLRINTKIGAVWITGNNLLIKEITKEYMVISGEIHCVEFKDEKGIRGEADCL
jgi:sporulation protein YqfC